MGMPLQCPQQVFVRGIVLLTIQSGMGINFGYAIAVFESKNSPRLFKMKPGFDAAFALMFGAGGY